MKSDDSKTPWKNGSLEVKLLITYEAEIFGKDGKYFLIEWAIDDGRMVEAKVPRKKFAHFPYPAEIGTWFGLVAYEEGGRAKKGVWPIAHHWNRELAGEGPEERPTEAARAKFYSLSFPLNS